MKLTIQELADIVNEQLKDEVEFKKDSRQSSVVSERRIRDYMTKGMLSKPYGDGKNKWFDEKHVEQLVALRLLQMRGLSDQYIVDNAGVIENTDDLTNSGLGADSVSGDLANMSMGSFESTDESQNILGASSSRLDDNKTGLSNASLAGSSVPKHFVNSEVIEYLKKSNSLYTSSPSSNPLKKGLEGEQARKLNTTSDILSNKESFIAQSQSVNDLNSTLKDSSSDDLKRQEDALSLLKSMGSGQSSGASRSVGAANINLGAMSFSKQAPIDTRKKVSDVDLFAYVSKKQDSKTYVEYVLDEENKIFLKVEQSSEVDIQKQQEIVRELKTFMLSLTNKGVSKK